MQRPWGALQMAITQRRPEPGLIHHSDRGSQYACFDYQAVLAQAGMLCSMSRKGDVWDNAPKESFFGRLKCELTHQWNRPPRAQARCAPTGPGARWVAGRCSPTAGYAFPLSRRERGSGGEV